MILRVPASVATRAAQRLLIPLRRRYYCGGRGRALVQRLPVGIRRKAGLDDDAAVGSRKIEIGCGPFPQEGYIHVDVDPGARHLEAFAPAWQLPFPDGFAEEIVAIHSLEHVHPRLLVPTLREWRRVLAPRGRVRVHVPNTTELMASFQESPVEHKWRIMGALLGMYCGPQVSRPEDLEATSDHQLLLDAEVLAWAFERAGFEDVVDLTETVTDRHTESWRDVVPHFSLVVGAVKRTADRVPSP
jgi:SAM-dependent methyltransferase